MDTLVLATIGKLWRHGHGVFGWCGDCGSPAQYWDDVKARRTPQPATFDIGLATLIRERGENSPVVGREPLPCPMWLLQHGNPDHGTGEADVAR